MIGQWGRGCEVVRTRDRKILANCTRYGVRFPRGIFTLRIRGTCGNSPNRPRARLRDALRGLSHKPAYRSTRADPAISGGQQLPQSGSSSPRRRARGQARVLTTGVHEPVPRPRKSPYRGRYLRASKNEQRLSREAQRTAIEAWAIREGVRVATWCIDHGVRSVSPMAERPALRSALAALRQHAAGVFVVAKRDRIARDVVLAASIAGAVALEGARVVSVSGEGNADSPADAFIRTVIDGAAQYEHGLIRSRTFAALAATLAVFTDRDTIARFTAELVAEHLAARGLRSCGARGRS
jgi:hypothetical protein